MRMFRFHMVYFLTAFSTATCALRSTGDVKHPNVLLIILDDLRPVLGCYGDEYAVSPNIDALASHGTIFTKAFAQQALCGPSRTSFLTSRRPDTTRLYDVHSYWRSHAGNFTTLPQYFKEHGYHTVSAGKVFHPGIVSNHSDDQPYSWSEDPYHPPTQANKQAAVCLGSDGLLHTNIYCPVKVDEQPGKSLPDIETTNFALQWLENRAAEFGDAVQNQPFFMAVGYHKPHIPLKFPARFLDFYPIDTVPMVPNGNLPKGLPSVAWNPWNDLRRRDDIKELNVSFPYGPLPDYYARYIRQGYYAATTYVDSLIGDLLSVVRKLFPDTIVALIGDHGWSLGEHQEWSKFSNYEVATRIPFIISKLDRSQSLVQKDSLNQDSAFTLHEIDSNDNVSVFRYIGDKYPDSEPDFTAKIHDGLVELVDLFPTLVDLAGLPFIPLCPEYSGNIKTCTEGISLAPILHKTVSFQNTDNFSVVPEMRKAVFSQYPRPSLKPSVSPDSDQPRTNETAVMGYSMRTSRFRYTAWLKFDNIRYKPDFSQIFAEELYDHKVDAGEDHNACGKKSYRFQKKRLFQQLMVGWREANH